MCLFSGPPTTMWSHGWDIVNIQINIYWMYWSLYPFKTEQNSPSQGDILFTFLLFFKKSSIDSFLAGLGLRCIQAFIRRVGTTFLVVYGLTILVASLEGGREFAKLLL